MLFWFMTASEKTNPSVFRLSNFFKRRRAKSDGLFLNLVFECGKLKKLFTIFEYSCTCLYTALPAPGAAGLPGPKHRLARARHPDHASRPAPSPFKI
jgi:hypothetical protein